MKQNEFNSKDIPSVDKMITALKYLNQGREVKFDQWTVRLAETIRGGFKLAWKNSDADNPEWFGLDVTLESFAEMCNELDDKEITIMQAEMVMTEAFKTQR